MNIVRLTIGLLLSVGLAMPVAAQDYDDIYYNASSAKAKKERTAKKEAFKAQQYHQAEETGFDYAPAGSYSSTAGKGIPMSVDDYNRRGIFAQGDTAAIAADSLANTSDYAYTQRIQRFHNPKVVSSDDPIAEYLASPGANVNIIVNNPGYYGYWGSPYTPWSPYAYDPFWGPSWSWAMSWGPSWSWGWGPAWSWGPSWSWGWGPAWSWGPSWGWDWGPGWGWGGGWYPPSRPTYGAPHRPGAYTSNPRRPGSVPSSGQRPGSYTNNNRRPSADGYRPGSGVYPGYNGSGVSGQRPGAGNSYRPGTSTTSRPGTSQGSYGRPGNSNTSGSYSRPGRGGNSNSGSSYRQSSTSSGSSRSSGGSYGGGGGGSRGGGGGSHGGRH